MEKGENVALALTKEQKNLVKTLRDELKLFCERNAQESIKKKYSRYFKEGYDAYGVESSLLNEKAKEILEKYRDKLWIDGFLYLGDLLFKNGSYEEKSLAILFIKGFKEDYSKETFKHIGKWFENDVNNWAHNDSLCSDVISHFIKKEIINLKDFSNWRSSKSKWKRRAVPVSMITYLKVEGIKPSLLSFIEPLMTDKERVVQQGLGWFLREAWKRDSKTVESFLLKWKNTSPRLIFQYATEKMNPEKKKLFKKDKNEQRDSVDYKIIETTYR